MGDNSDINALIIVCCHAIWMGAQHKDCPTLKFATSAPFRSNCSHDDAHDEQQWAIKPFQQGETDTFVKHIRIGMNILESAITGNISSHAAHEGLPDVRVSWTKDPAEPPGQLLNPLLCFSGGRTDADRTSMSEAESYARVAETLLSQDESERGFDKDIANEMRKRVVLEEWATDSMQNVLLSLIQYGRWKRNFANRNSSGYSLELPRYLIIVSHEFKKMRFLNLHLPAVQQLWPWHRMGPDSAWGPFKIRAFYGLDPPLDEEKRAALLQGDLENGYGAWRRDKFGTGLELRSKRLSRGWNEAEYVLFIELKLIPVMDKLAVRKMIRGHSEWQSTPHRMH